MLLTQVLFLEPSCKVSSDLHILTTAYAHAHKYTHVHTQHMQAYTHFEGNCRPSSSSETHLHSAAIYPKMGG